MPVLLKEKLAAILDDEYTPRYEKLNLLEELFNQEVGYLEATHIVTGTDLYNITSNATKTLVDMPLEIDSPLAKDQSKLRALSFTFSVLSWMREKGLVNFLLEYKDKAR